GFPQGLQITRAEIAQKIGEQGDGAYNGRLVVMLKATSEKLGEAALHPPDDEGIAETDVKLLPEDWQKTTNRSGSG
ncbi:MAG: hypothetical protein R6X34_12430, partial [Chloroflexota bacterium]